MKQFTTSEQTAKLIELGFEKPKSEVKAEQAGDYAWFNPAYSIGELIDMFPQIITMDYCIYSRVISENEVFYYSWELETYFCICDDNSQLVDNLFDAIVKLKEEGVI